MRRSRAIWRGMGDGLMALALVPVALVGISLAVIFNQIALSLFAARMRIMLKVFGINISGVQSLRIHLQSVLYFFVLPMTVGLEAAETKERDIPSKAKRLGESCPDSDAGIRAWSGSNSNEVGVKRVEI